MADQIFSDILKVLNSNADRATQIAIVVGSSPMQSFFCTAAELKVALEGAKPTPVQTKRMYVVVDGGTLNVRVGPGTGYAAMRQLADRTPIDVEVSPIGVKGWLKLVGELAWVSELYVKDTLPAAPPPTPAPKPTTPPTPPAPAPKPRTGSKMSFHIMPTSALDALYGTMERLAKAGKPLPGVTAVKFGWESGDPLVTRIKAASPQTEVVLRHYNEEWERKTSGIQWAFVNESTGRDFVRNYYIQFLGANLDSHKADTHQIVNEPSYHGQGTTAFWIGAMAQAEEMGIRLALPNFSWGNPKLPPEDSFWLNFVPALERCQEKGHRFALHQYIGGDDPPFLDRPDTAWNNDWSLMRHRRVFACLPDTLKGLPLALNEFGTAYAKRDYSPEGLVHHLREADEALRGDPNVIWAALWTFGGGGAWQDSLLESKLEAIERHLLQWS